MTDEPFYSRPVVWRNITFDSVLESSWAASMTVWGIDWVFHPGRFYLSNGEAYEPDFLLRNAGEWAQDILLEVKGPSDDRIHKPQLLQESFPDQIVLIGREPYLRGDDLGQYPAAVWHRTDGSPYVWDIDGRGREYVSGEQATAKSPGLKFYRALENSRKIR